MKSDLSNLIISFKRLNGVKTKDVVSHVLISIDSYIELKIILVLTYR